MSLRKNVANFLSGGAVIQAQRTRIEMRMQLRRERIRARYEAAYWNTARSYLPSYIQSAREDINTLSRQEILRRTRYFEKNNAVMDKVLDVKDVNVIGSGIRPAPAAKDTDWGKRALEWWNEWIEVADITTLSSYYKLQSISYRAQNVDGDNFFRKCFSPAGRPALDVIGAHRCGTGGVDIGAIERSGFKVVDGVIIDLQFKIPRAYLIADDFDGSKVQAYPASEIIPVWNRRRAGQYRGLTLFHAGILDIHDLDDLQKYEMRAAKDAASISRIIKTQAGAVTPDGNAIGASLTALPNADPATRVAYYKQALGGEVLVPQVGDEITQFESKRPSAATTGFWDRLDAKFAQGSGISYPALVDYRVASLGGATLRACLESDNRRFELETIDQARAAQKVWEFAIGWAIAHGEVPKNPDWNKVRWHPPRRTTVDVGNDSAARLEELKAGRTTYQDEYGETGEDWRERLDQRAQEEAYIDELAAKYKIPRQLIASFAMERLAGQAPDAVGPTPAPGEGGGKGETQ